MGRRARPVAITAGIAGATYLQVWASGRVRLPGALAVVAFAPALGAGLATPLLLGPEPLRALLRSALRRPPWRLLAVALGLPLAVALAALALGEVAGVRPSTWLGSADPGLLAGALLAGVVEEPAWRGLLQPALRARLPALPAWCIVGLVWWGWHQVGALTGPGGIAALMTSAQLAGAVYVVAVAVVYGWLYERSGESLAVPVAAHAGMHLGYVLFAEGAVLQVAVVIWVGLGAAVAARWGRSPRREFRTAAA